MLKKTMLIPLMLISIWANAQELFISGKVIDKKSQHPIEGANIYVKSVHRGTATKTDGSFRINLPQKGTYSLQITTIGYEKETRTVTISDTKTFLVIEMKRATTELEGIQIIGHKRHNTKDISNVSKLNVPTKDLPLTISSVDKEFLQQVQVYNINDAMRYATGIKPTVNYGGFQTFKMRGFGSPIIMLDGARDERMNYSNSAPLTSLAAVERIEYLKGPASVLYGHSAVGGILNIVRKQPTEEFTANFSASYGTWERKNTAVGAGGKLCENVNFRFDASLADNNGWRDNATKTANAYVGLDFHLNRKNLIQLRWGANNDFYGTETGFPLLSDSIYDLNGNLKMKKGDIVDGFKSNQRYNAPEDFLKHKNQNVSLKYIHQFEKNSSLSLYSSYSDDLIDYFSTEELSFPTDDKPIYKHYFMHGGKKKYIDLEHLQRTYPLRFSHETKTLQNYIEYTKTFNIGNIKNDFLGGYYLMFVDRTSFSGYNLGFDVYGKGLYGKVSVKDPILNQGDLNTRFSGASMYKETINSLYFQDLLDISQQLKAMIAARIDLFNMSYQRGKVKTGREINEKGEKSGIVNKAFTYRAGLVYQPIEALSLYASASNYFRPKRTTYNENYIYIDKNGKEFFPEKGKEVFKPESGYQFEGGFKYNCLNLLNVNVAAYYIKKENITEYMGKSDDGKRIYAQVGAIDSKGVEIDLTVTPTSGLSLTSGYTFSQAKYQKFSTNKYKTNSKEGNFLVRNPQHQFFTWAHYTVPTGYLKNLKFGLGANYTSEMYTSASNDYKIPSYWLTEASIGYTFSNVTLLLKVNNILDTEYFSNSVMSNQFIPGEARNCMMTVSYKF